MSIPFNEQSMREINYDDYLDSQIPPETISVNSCAKCGEPCVYNLCPECNYLDCFRKGMA
jgi:hypothetical protein